MMLSTCPNCLSQIEHELNATVVKCSCSTEFSPFLTPQDEKIEAPNELKPFLESESVYQELRDFGKELNLMSQNTKINIPPPPADFPDETDLGVAPSTESPLQTTQTPNLNLGDSGHFLITAGDSFSGYEIKQFFTPLSLWTDLDTLNENPLQVGIEKLWTKGLEFGANAIIGLRWTLSVDLQKALIVGTPVEVQKI